jgi:hypothetical protein
MLTNVVVSSVCKLVLMHKVQQIQKSHFQKSCTSASLADTDVRADRVKPDTKPLMMEKLNACKMNAEQY